MLALAIVMTVVAGGCKPSTTATPGAVTVIRDSAATVIRDSAAVAKIDKVLTAEEQKALSPDSVIESLKEGNTRFVNNKLTSRNYPALVRDAAAGQYPEAVILSCLDSRVTVEDAFDKGIGDLFVCRVAGNFANKDILASMEYGCKVSGAKVIVVLGHTQCGAIKSAIDKVQLGNITALLEKIEPAVMKSQDYKGKKSSKNSEYVSYVAVNNVIHTMAMIRQNSPLLQAMEENGEIRIVGAMYDLQTGKISFLP